MISDPIQTTRALLTWQRPLDAGEPRDRHVVGELTEGSSSHDIQFRYFPDEDLVPARELGFEGYPGLPVSAYQGEPRCENVEAVFMRRLPPLNRPDFSRFMQTFGLSPDAGFSSLSLLAYTGARTTSDSFGIAETFDGFDRPFNYLFDVAGFRRYQDNAKDLSVGDDVHFAPEPENQADPNAIQILDAEGRCLGYINRAQAARVREWLETGQIQASVFRFNGRTDYPKLFLMARVSPRLELVAA